MSEASSAGGDAPRQSDAERPRSSSFPHAPTAQATSLSPTSVDDVGMAPSNVTRSHSLKPQSGATAVAFDFSMVAGGVAGSAVDVAEEDLFGLLSRPELWGRRVRCIVQGERMGCWCLLKWWLAIETSHRVVGGMLARCVC